MNIFYLQVIYFFLHLRKGYFVNGYSDDKEELQSIISRIEPREEKCGNNWTCDAKTSYCLNPDTGSCGICDCKTYIKGRCEYRCKVLPELFAFYGRVREKGINIDGQKLCEPNLKPSLIAVSVACFIFGVLAVVFLWMCLRNRKERNAPDVDEEKQKSGCKPVYPEQDAESDAILINTTSATDKYLLDETSEKIV